MAWEYVTKILNYTISTTNYDPLSIPSDNTVVVTQGNNPLIQNPISGNYDNRIYFNSNSYIRIYGGTGSFSRDIYVNGSSFMSGTSYPGGGQYKKTDWFLLIDDETQRARIALYNTQLNSGTTYTNIYYDSASDSLRAQLYTIIKALMPTVVASSNGGGATHIAKRTGQLKNLSSYTSDILLVSGGGGGGMITQGSSDLQPYIDKLKASAYGTTNQITLLQYSISNVSYTAGTTISNIYSFITGSNFNSDSGLNSLYFAEIGTVNITISENIITASYNFTNAPSNCLSITYRDSFGSWHTKSGNYATFLTVYNNWLPCLDGDMSNLSNDLPTFTTSFNTMEACLQYLTQHFRHINVTIGGVPWESYFNTLYAGADAGGISGNNVLSGNQLSGYAFGQGEDGESVPCGGAGLYGGLKGVSIYSGGAGSGYIGNSALDNKKMVGYNVPTSSAPDTKTESVQVYSSIAEVDKPKAGNGFVRIKFIKEPPLDSELVDMINGDGFFWKNWNASIVYGTYDTTMTWNGGGNYKSYTWVTNNGDPVTTSSYKTTTGGVAFIAVGAKQTLFINKTTNGYSGTIGLGSRIANQWKGSGSVYWQDAKFAYKNGSTQWSDWPDGSVNAPGSLSYSAETIKGVLEYFAKRLRNIYIAVDDNTLYSMAKTHSMTGVQGYVTSSIDESSVNNLSSYFGTDRILRIEHSSWASSYIRQFDGYTAGCDATNGLVFTYSYIPINRTKVKSIRFKAAVPTQYGQQNAMIQVKTAYFSGNTMMPNAGSASWNPSWQGTWQEYVLSYTDPVNVDYIQIKTGYNDWYIKDVIIYKD